MINTLHFATAAATVNQAHDCQKSGTHLPK